MLARAFFLLLLLPSLTFAAKQKESSNSLVVPYFPQSAVEATLDKYGVPLKQKLGMIKDLEKVDQLVTRLVVERAHKLNPNPLLEPYQEEATTTLLRGAITDVFTKIAKKHGITHPKQIEAILSDLQREKSLQFSDQLHAYAENLLSK